MLEMERVRGSESKVSRRQADAVGRLVGGLSAQLQMRNSGTDVGRMEIGRSRWFVEMEVIVRLRFQPRGDTGRSGHAEPKTNRNNMLRSSKLLPTGARWESYMRRAAGAWAGRSFPDKLLLPNIDL